MLEPLTNQPNEQAQLQVEFADLKQENTELRSQLEACQSENEELQQHKQEVQRSYRILEATAQATDALLTIHDFDSAVTTALQILGESLETDRTKVLESLVDDPVRPFSRYHNVLYEWTSPDTVQQLSHPQGRQVDTRGRMESFFEMFLQNNGFGGLLAAWDESLHAPFQALGVKSLYVVPIWVDRQWWGLLAFDDCREAKHCTQAEMAALQTAANCIGSAIQRQRTQQAIFEAELERTAELERANNALQSTVAALAERRDLDGFIGEVLQTIAREFESPLVEYWTFRGVDTAEVHTWLCANQLFSRQHNDEHPGRGGIRFLPEFINFEDVIRSNQVLVFETPVPAYSLALGQVICPTAWYTARGAAKHFNFRLKIGGLNIGSISVWLPPEQQLTDAKLQLGQALSHQTALAIQMTQLAEKAKQAAIAREQEQAAQARLAELAKANEALQQTIDALGCVSDFDEFVPAVLKIVAQAFGTNACGYYEHSEEEPIYLRYWFSNDRVLNPMELQLLDPELYPTLRKLAHGFTVAPEHLHGTTVRGRTHPVILDHRTMTVTPEFHAFAVAQGWELELNQPLVVDGQAEGAIVIYRPAHQPFTDREIALAETLAKPLALALQAQRLATQTREQAVEAAIAREQEQAARERAAELAKANESLRRSLDRLANERHLDSFLAHVLQEAIQILDGAIAQIFLYEPESDTLISSVGIDRQGEVFPAPGLMQELPIGQPFPANITGVWQRLLNSRGAIHFDLDRDAEDFWPGTIEWHRSMGHHGTVCVAMMMGDRPLGILGLAFRERTEFTAAEFEFVQALGQQATLAIQLTRLAEEAKQAALLEERNRMAREIHDTLAQSFTSIRMHLEAATRLLSRKPEQAQACITFAQELAQAGLAEARRSVWALQPEAEDYRHLSATLERLAVQQTAETSIQVEVAIVGTPYALPPDVGMNLLRIGQEALNNAIRHASAQTILLTLTYAPSQIQLQIQDDGQGFDPQLKLSSGGFGMMGMQQRSDRLGGTFTISSKPGHGTEVRLTVPFPPSPFLP